MINYITTHLLFTLIILSIIGAFYIGFFIQYTDIKKLQFYGLFFSFLTFFISLFSWIFLKNMENDFKFTFSQSIPIFTGFCAPFEYEYFCDLDTQILTQNWWFSDWLKWGLFFLLIVYLAVKQIISQPQFIYNQKIITFFYWVQKFWFVIIFIISSMLRIIYIMLIDNTQTYYSLTLYAILIIIISCFLIFLKLNPDFFKNLKNSNNNPWAQTVFNFILKILKQLTYLTSWSASVSFLKRSDFSEEFFKQEKKVNNLISYFRYCLFVFILAGDTPIQQISFNFFFFFFVPIYCYYYFLEVDKLHVLRRNDINKKVQSNFELFLEYKENIATNNFIARNTWGPKFLKNSQQVRHFTLPRDPNFWKKVFHDTVDGFNNLHPAVKWGAAVFSGYVGTRLGYPENGQIAILNQKYLLHTKGFYHTEQDVVSRFMALKKSGFYNENTLNKLIGEDGFLNKERIKIIYEEKYLKQLKILYDEEERNGKLNNPGYGTVAASDVVEGIIQPSMVKKVLANTDINVPDEEIEIALKQGEEYYKEARKNGIIDVELEELIKRRKQSLLKPQTQEYISGIISDSGTDTKPSGK